MTTAPPLLAPFTGASPIAALREARAIIEDAITNQPRSLQTRIGPSEIGTPCDHCLAAKLAGWSKTEDGVPWLPFIGTAVHAALEEIFNTHNATHHDGGLEWLPERKVTIGDLLGEPVTGHSDLFHIPAGTVVDWKIVGKTTLRKAKTGPSRVYRYQAHSYGQGYANEGLTVAHVAIYFLPRDAVSLDQAIPWTEPFMPALAAEALTRAAALATNVAAMATLGDEARDAWISALPRDPECWDCRRYQDAPTATAAAGNFADLYVGN